MRKTGAPAGLEPEVAARCLIASLWGLTHILVIDRSSHDLEKLTRVLRALFLRGGKPSRRGAGGNST